MNVEQFIEELISKKLEELNNESLSKMGEVLSELEECFDLILCRLQTLENNFNKDVKLENPTQEDQK